MTKIENMGTKCVEAHVFVRMVGNNTEYWEFSYKELIQPGHFEMFDVDGDFYVKVVEA